MTTIAFIIQGKKFIPSLPFYLVLPLFYLFNPYKKSRTLTLNNKTYNAYIADNFFSRAFGYMFRDPTDLKPDEAILFSFNTRQTVSFTMSNVYFPIMIFALDENYKILSSTLMKTNQNEKTILTGTYFLEVPARTLSPKHDL